MGVTGGTGGAGGFMIPECPMEPGPAMCGTEACESVAAGLLCIKTCCTTDNLCGTKNNLNPTCMETVENTSMCPNETILGQMTPGCCVEGSNDCGIVNVLTGDPPCYRRQDVPLAPLSPLHCDGTPVMAGGAGGAGGMGGMGGMGGEGGMGGADPDAGM